MRGRTPTPTNAKLLKGNPGRRPINLDTFAPEAVIPRCPPELTGDARKEYKRITTELHKCRMLAEVDRNLIAMACVTWARFIEAEKMIAKAAQGGGSGLFVKTPNGFPIQSPWLAVSNKAIEQYKSLCAEFGLSPAARVRVAPQTSQLDLPGFQVIEGGVKPPIEVLFR